MAREFTEDNPPVCPKHARSTACTAWFGKPGQRPQILASESKRDFVIIVDHEIAGVECCNFNELPRLHVHTRSLRVGGDCVLRRSRPRTRRF